MEVSLEQLRQVIAEALATANPNKVMMEIIAHFAELGLSPGAIIEQLNLLGYSMC